MKTIYTTDPLNESKVIIDNEKELKNYLRDAGYYTWSDMKSILTEFKRKKWVEL